MKMKDCNRPLIPTLGLMGRAEEITELILKIVIGVRAAIPNPILKTLISRSFAALMIGDCLQEMS